MRCAVWYHLYNLKNVKNTHGGVLLLVKLQAKRLKRITYLFFFWVKRWDTDKFRKTYDLLFQWFNDNYIKANEIKCHVFVTTIKNVMVYIRTTQIQSSSRKLLGMKIDFKLDFEDHRKYMQKSQC